MSKIDVFSDIFAQNDNFLTSIEARTKIGFIVLALAINLSADSIYTSIAFLILSLILLLLIHIPLKLIALRLAMPLLMATVILLTQLFFYGETPLFSLSIFGLIVNGFSEGLEHGIVIICRVLGGVSLILLLSMSTPANKLFAAAMWFRIPRTFIEIALLIYRYIFVLLEELIIMKDAQKVRLGYYNWNQSMKSLSMLGACTILRAYDRAERVFEAMLLRGYTCPQLSYNLVFDKKDSAVAICLAILLAGFYLVGRINT